MDKNNKFKMTAAAILNFMYTIDYILFFDVKIMCVSHE